MYTVKNSTEFVHMLKDVTIKPGDQLASCGVTTLFTQVPHDNALVVVSKKLTEGLTLQERTMHYPCDTTCSTHRILPPLDLL